MTLDLSGSRYLMNLADNPTYSLQKFSKANLVFLLVVKANVQSFGPQSLVSQLRAG